MFKFSWVLQASHKKRNRKENKSQLMLDIIECNFHTIIKVYFILVKSGVPTHISVT